MCSHKGVDLSRSHMADKPSRRAPLGKAAAEFRKVDKNRRLPGWEALAFYAAWVTQLRDDRVGFDEQERRYFCLRFTSEGTARIHRDHQTQMQGYAIFQQWVHILNLFKSHFKTNATRQPHCWRALSHSTDMTETLSVQHTAPDELQQRGDKGVWTMATSRRVLHLRPARFVNMPSGSAFIAGQHRQAQSLWGRWKEVGKGNNKKVWMWNSTLPSQADLDK